jgi:hypothetical protein
LRPFFVQNPVRTESAARRRLTSLASCSFCRRAEIVVSFSSSNSANSVTQASLAASLAKSRSRAGLSSVRNIVGAFPTPTRPAALATNAACGNALCRRFVPHPSTSHIECWSPCSGLDVHGGVGGLLQIARIRPARERRLTWICNVITFKPRRRPIGALRLTDAHGCFFLHAENLKSAKRRCA